MEYKTNIQEIIKELTSRMNLIIGQLRIIFDSIENFKHKRHLIIFSYLLGYYTSKGNDKFNKDILMNSIEILERSLTRKTEISNLIIAISLSLNKYNENENKNQEDERLPRMNVSETAISNNPYDIFMDLFGKTVMEKPLNELTGIPNKYIIQNNKNVANHNDNKKINKNEIMVNEIHANNVEINNISINSNLEGKENTINKNTVSNIYNSKIIPKAKKSNIINTVYNNQLNNQPSYNVKTINTSSEYNIQEKLEGIEIPHNKNKKNEKCFLCIENFNELDKNNYKINCKCIFHKKCFNNYISNSIKSQNIPILCPKCQKEINNYYIYKSLNSIGNKDLIKEYENCCLNLYIQNYPQYTDIVYYCCPTPGCKNYIPCKTNETKLVCQNCKKEYCIKCYRPWHDNKNCEEYLMETLYNNNQIGEQIYQIEENKDKYRECPKCQSIMVKEKGTNKILCVCGFIFCYKCGKSFKEKHGCK